MRVSVYDKATYGGEPQSDVTALGKPICIEPWFRVVAYGKYVSEPAPAFAKQEIQGLQDPNSCRREGTTMHGLSQAAESTDFVNAWQLVWCLHRQQLPRVRIVDEF